MKLYDKTHFLSQVEASINEFSGNDLFKFLDTGNLDLKIYHRFLKTIFHQTFFGPSTFALAAVNCSSEKWLVRDYLLHHAAEEKDHWQWIIEDLKNTGYNGPDPRDEYPQLSCQNYVSFNYYIAIKCPIARLGIAAVLEGIGASFAKKNAISLCRKLGLEKDQAKFIFGHGDTDVGHSDDILKILEKSSVSTDEWRWLVYSAETAGKLYRNMYNSVVSA